MKPELDQSQLQSALLDNFPHPLMLIGKDRKIIAANPAAREMGAEIGEFCWGGFGKCHFIPDADRDYFAEHEEAPPEGTHCSFCKAEDCLNSQVPQNNPAVEAFDRIFDTYWTPLGEDRFLHYAIDVTEKTQAEEALHERDVRFRALFDGMSNGVAVYNAVDDGADFVFVDINPAGQEMDNIPLEKAVGRKVTEVFPGVEEFGLLDVLRRVWQTGVPEELPISEYKDNQISYWRKNRVYKLPSGEIVAIYSDETAAKQAEAVILAENARFVAVMDSLDAIVYAADIQTHEVLFANQRAKKDRGELIGETCWKVLQAGQTEPCAFCTNDKLLDADGNPTGPYIWETQNTQDGRWYQCRDEAIQWPDGRIVRLEIATDITDRKQAESTLREYERIVSSTTDNLSFIDTNYAYRAVNDAYLTAHDKTRDEIIGHSVAEILGAKVFENTVKPSFDRCLAGKPQNYQEWFDFKGAGRRYMDVAYYPFRDNDGPISGVVVSSRDITELQQAEIELIDQKRRLDYILEGTNMGTWEWNVQTGEMRINPRWAEIIGYTLEELSPISIDTWIKNIHPDDLTESNRLLQKCFCGKTEYYHFEARMRHKNGEFIWVLDQGKIATRTQDGKPEWMYGTYQDITKRKLAEEQVRDSLKEKEVLLREIHHRVKNNLQVIVSLLRMHARRSNNEQVQRVFGDCRNRVNAMSLIHEALYRSEDLARIDTEPYLEKLCRHLRQAHGASDKGIALTVGNNDLPLGMDQGVAVGMIVCELASNIFKHAFPEGEPGSVLVSLSSVGEDDVELIVQDDGVGLPPDVDISNTPSLGLHLVSITATHELGGTIEVERDGGTRFIIRFKRKDI